MRQSAQPPQPPLRSHSMHPQLRGFSGAALSADAAAASAAMGGGGAMGVDWVPYPTPAQHAHIEAQFRSALAAAEPGTTPVRQPPTMLAAMQREDLTADARGRVLQQLAPPAALERKYKVVFDSSARTEPQRTGPGDFAVRVTADVLPVRANGFELVGYSFPQAEWTLEPGETSIPTRFGWCARPGARLYGVYAPQDDGGRALLCVEMPLPSNPIVRAEVLAAAPVLGLPARVRLTLARRVGAVPAALAARAALTVENLGPVAAYTPSSRTAVLDEIQTAYAAATSPPPAEAPLSLRAGLDLAAVSVSAAADSPENQLTLLDPALVAALAAFEGGDVPLTPAAVLRFAPPAGAADLAAVLTAQFRHLLAHRRFLEDAQPAQGRVALTRLEVALADEASRAAPLPRLMLRAGWDHARWRQRLPHEEGEGEGEEGQLYTQQQYQQYQQYPHPRHAPRYARPFAPPPGPLDAAAAVLGAASDGMAARFGLPAAHGGELRGGGGQGAGGGSETYATLGTPWQAEYVAARPALLPAATTAEAAPLPEGAPLEAFFQSLNTSATSMRFAPPAAPAAATFGIPVLFGGAVHTVAVPAGEYRPWGLARAITEAARQAPALRPLLLVATPVGLAHGNTLAGFRLASAAASPVPFGLAWDAAAADPAALIAPARLGFRALRYDGQSAYDPELLGATGTLAPITFPAADLGLGAPSPPPAVPYFLPAAGNKRLQIHLVGLDAVGVAARADGWEARAAAAERGALELDTARAALFHHLQPLTLQMDAAADQVRLLDGSLAGPDAALLGEAPAVANALEAFRFDPATFPHVPRGTPGTATRADLDLADVLGVLRLLFAPSAATLDAPGATLAHTLAALLGRPGGAYGMALAPPAELGDYRALLDLLLASSSSSLPAAASPFSAAQLPSGSTVDGWLRRVAEGRDVRAMFALLAETLLRLEAWRVTEGGGLPLGGANGGASAGTLAAVLRAHVTAASAPARTLLADPAADLVRTALHLAAPRDLAEGVLSVLAPSGNPAQLLVGARYALTEGAAGVRVDAAASVNLVRPSHVLLDPVARTLEILPGAFGGGPGPHTLALALPGDPLPPALLAVAIPYETGAGVTFARAFAGHGAQINYDPAAVAPDPDAAALAANLDPATIAVDAAAGVVTFAVAAQPSGAGAPPLAATFPFLTATTTLQLDDGALARLAKLYLVAAAGGSAAAPAVALVDLRGTHLHPFDAAAALANLRGLPAPAPPAATRTTAPSTAFDAAALAAAASPATLRALLGQGDPGLDTRALTLALGGAPAALAPSSLDLPDDLAGTAPAVPWAALWEEMLRAAAPTPARPKPATVLRHSPFPFSLDFASATDTRIRPERMGFAESEYVFANPAAAAAAAAANSSTALVSASLRSAPVSASLRSAPVSASLRSALVSATGGSSGGAAATHFSPLSAFDVDRSGPPYLLLSIEVNGAPPESLPGEEEGPGRSALPAAAGSAYHGSANSHGALSSISESSRQIVSATAYVQVGSDANTLRLLDRQDDRSPVTFPTSAFVHTVRFRTMRPDGRPYNFHGRRVMVALRFLTHTDNPNFVAASQEHAKAKQAAAAAAGAH